MPSENPSSELKLNLWMPLDIGPFLQDTAHLSTEEIGAYTLLLLYYWAHGPLPNDPKRLANIAKMTVDAWSITQASLSMFLFLGSDGLLHQKGADRRRAQWLDRKLKAKEKAIKAANARWGKQKAKPDTSSNAPSMLQAMPEEMLEQCPTSVVQVQKQKTSSPTLLTPAAQEGTGSQPKPPHQAGRSPRRKAEKQGSVDKAKPVEIDPRTRPKDPVKGNVRTGRKSRSAARADAGKPYINEGVGPSKVEESTQDKKIGMKGEVLRFWNAGELVGYECPWAHLDDRGLGRFVKENPGVDLTGFIQLLKNRAASEGINRAELPRKWLRSLIKYADGPLDRYGKPLKPRRGGKG